MSNNMEDIPRMTPIRRPSNDDFYMSGSALKATTRSQARARANAITIDDPLNKNLQNIRSLMSKLPLQDDAIVDEKTEPKTPLKDVIPHTYQSTRKRLVRATPRGNQLRNAAGVEAENDDAIDEFNMLTSKVSKTTNKGQTAVETAELDVATAVQSLKFQKTVKEKPLMTTSTSKLNQARTDESIRVVQLESKLKSKLKSRKAVNGDRTKVKTVIIQDSKSYASEQDEKETAVKKQTVKATTSSYKSKSKDKPKEAVNKDAHEDPNSENDCHDSDHDVSSQLAGTTKTRKKQKSILNSVEESETDKTMKKKNGKQDSKTDVKEEDADDEDVQESDARPRSERYDLRRVGYVNYK